MKNTENISKTQRENLKNCNDLVPSKLRKTLKAQQSQTLGWLINKNNWDNEEEIRYTKAMIAEDLGISESTVISILKTLVNKNLIEKTFIGKRKIPSRVKFTEKFNSYSNNNSNSTKSENQTMTAEETVTVETRNINTNDSDNSNVMEMLLGEIDVLKKSMKILHKGLKNLEEENGKLKQSMKILNDKMNILRKENSELKEEISTLKKSNTKANIDSTPTECPRNAGNTPKIEENTSMIYSPISEVKTPSETILKPSASINEESGDRKSQIDKMTLGELYKERTRHWYKYHSNDPYVEMKIEEKEAERKGKKFGVTIVETPLSQETPQKSPTIAPISQDDEVYTQDDEKPTEAISEAINNNNEGDESTAFTPKGKIQCELMKEKFDRITKGLPYDDIDKKLLSLNEGKQTQSQTMGTDVECESIKITKVTDEDDDLPFWCVWNATESHFTYWVIEVIIWWEKVAEKRLQREITRVKNELNKMKYELTYKESGESKTIYKIIDLSEELSMDKGKLSQMFIDDNDFIETDEWVCRRTRMADIRKKEKENKDKKKYYKYLEYIRLYFI